MCGYFSGKHSILYISSTLCCRTSQAWSPVRISSHAASYCGKVFGSWQWNAIKWSSCQFVGCRVWPLCQLCCGEEWEQLQGEIDKLRLDRKLTLRQDWYELEIREFGCYLPLAKVRNTRSLKLALGSSTSNKVSQLLRNKLLGLQWLDQSSPSRKSGSLYVPGHQKRPQLQGSRQTPDPGMKSFNLSCHSLPFSTHDLVLQLLIWSFAKKVHTTKVFASGSWPVAWGSWHL